MERLALTSRAQRSPRLSESFAERRLDPEPDGSDKARDDHSNDRLESIALHATKDDDAVAGRFDLVAEQPEAASDPERSDLALNQALARLRQRALRLSNA